MCISMSTNSHLLVFDVQFLIFSLNLYTTVEFYRFFVVCWLVRYVCLTLLLCTIALLFFICLYLSIFVLNDE